MNLNIYTKTKQKLVSFRKFVVVSTFSLLSFGYLSAQTLGTGLSFDGVSNYVNVPVSPSLNISSNLTLEAWVYPTNSTTQVQDVICKSSDYSSDGYIFPRTSDGWKTVEFLLNINGWDWQTLKVNFGANGQPRLNEWHHLAATYDGYYMSIYVDGVLKGSLQFAGSITVNNNPLVLGGQTGFVDEYFGGKLDEVKVWNRALSQCEINNNMNCELSGTQTGLAAYYKFNQGLINLPNPLVTTVTDASGNNNTGSLTNFGLTGLLSNWTVGKVTGSCSVFTPVTVVAGSPTPVIPIGGTINLTATVTGGAQVGTVYSWTGPNGYTSSAQNPSISGVGINASGSYTVTATVNGCSATASVNITVAQFASALNLDGNNDVVVVPNSATLNPSSSISVETWVYPTSTSPSVQNVISKSNLTNSTGYIFPRTDDGWRTFSFWLNINGQWRVLSAQYPNLNQWNHVAATYDGFNMKIYLNGNLVGTQAVTGTITVNTNDLTIGQQAGYTEFFKGSIDETRIWSRALGQCEIVNNLNCQLNGGVSVSNPNGIRTQTGLAAYYRYNQGLVGVDNSAVNRLADSSGNNNHGTLQSLVLNGNISNWVLGNVNSTCGKFTGTIASAGNNGPIVEAGTTLSLTSTAGNSWSWTGPNGFTSTLQNPTIPNVTLNATGTYTVIITGSGCTSTASTSVTIAFKGGTLNFNGGANFITVPNNASLNISKTITAESWINPTDNVTLIQDVMSKSTRSVNNGYIFPRTDDGWKTISFYLYINGAYQILTTPYPGINQWHHTAATYDGFFMRIYIDGILVATKEANGDITVNSNDLTIGNQPGYSEFYSGQVDESRIWSRALNQCEIINNMNCELDPAQTTNGLAAYYKYNQGYADVTNTTVTTLIDASPNANTGTLTGFALQGTSSNWSGTKISTTCLLFSQPPVTATANATVFGVGSTIQLLATGGTLYDWSGPNSFASTNARVSIANAQINATGTYTVTAHFVKCDVMASTRLVVSTIDPITANAPTTICPSGSVTLSMRTAGVAYQWYKDDAIIPGATTNSYVATQTGNYTISVSDSKDIFMSAPVTVTVIDNIAPVPDVTVLPTLNLATPNAIVTTIPTATDNCRGVINGTTNSPLVYNTPGTYTITWTYNDQNGQIVTQNQTVIVVVGIDNTPPVLTVPANISLAASTSTCGSVANFTATATDDSGLPVTITYSTNPGTLFPAGITPVTVTATDAQGNVMTGTFTVSVSPTIVLPITGNTSICAGATTTLASATTGGTWSSSNNAVASVNASGLVTGISAGTVSILYTNNCGVTASATVTVNAVPSASISAGGPTTFCSGGSVTLTASTGTTYLWSNGSTASSIAVTNSGTYTVTVNNGSGCSATSTATSVTVNPTPAATISASGSTTFCSGGSVTLTASAGSSYLWSNGSTASSISVANSGTYTVTVTNASGCSATSAATTVTVNAVPTATITAGGPTTFCSGSSVTLTASAGATYLWSNGSTAPSISVANSGTYSVTVKNASGCSATSTATSVTVNPTPVATISASGLTTFCSGGSVTLTASAGSSYLWSNGSTASSISVTTSGNFTVTVSNASGCSVTSAATTVSVNAVPTATITAVGPTTFCSGGSVTLTASVGSSYLWSNGSTASSISVANTGTYTVTVNNGSGCSATSTATSVTVNPTPAASISASGSTTFCSGGSVTLTASAGSSYLWSNGSTASSIAVANSGIYTVTVTNASGCSATSTATTVTVNTTPSATISASGATTFCSGGSVTLTASTGTSYLWSNGSTASSISVANSGTYSVTVKNASGCSATSGVTSITVNPIPVASITASGATTFCAGGAVTLTASTGTSYLWSNGSTASSISVANTGTYTVTVTNASGCSTTSSATSVIVNALPVASITASGATTFCAGGSVTLTASAGSSYLWSNGSTASSISIANSGTYTVTVTNASGCSSTSAATSVTVNANPVSAITASGATTFCSGGSVTLTASAGASYLWSNGATTQAISVITAGAYSVTVKNASGCSATSTATTVTVNAIPSAAITGSGATTFCAGGSVVLTATAGTSYLWSNGATTQTITATTSGSYSVTVTNASGCSSTSAATVVTVNALPATPLITVTNNCGNTVLATTAAGTLLWSNNISGSNTTVTTAGTYSVTVTNASGCSVTSAPVSVTVNTNPVVNPISGNTSVGVNVTSQLSNTTPGGVWSSSNANVTVSSTGLIKGITGGTATISYTVTGTGGCSSSATVVFTVSSCTTSSLSIPVITVNAPDFCNKINLTASTAAAGAVYKWTYGTAQVGSASVLSLGQSNADGVYQVSYTVPGGCTSGVASYNFQKQNLISSYTLLATSYIGLGVNNTVASGSVGVSSYWGWMSLGSNDSVASAGSFVKAPWIGYYGWNINIANPIYGTANVTLPTMYFDILNTAGLPNMTVSTNNQTVNGNYANLTIKKGITATIGGSNFGTIRIEQGAQVTFTSPNITADNIQIVKGPRNGYSYVRFNQDTKIMVSDKVTIGSKVYVNPDNKVVTFYLGDNSKDREGFKVTGGDTRVTANIYMPNGALNVTGGYRYGDYGNGFGDCDKDDDDNIYYGQGNSYVYMTGTYIADEIDGNGKNVIWNKFDCSAPPVPVVYATSSLAPVTQQTISSSFAKTAEASTSEEELKITVMPNPSTTYFTLKFESKYETPLNLRVMDASGRVVDAKSKVGSNSTLQIGANYASGTYFAEITQGGTRKVIQLIKVRG